MRKKLEYQLILKDKIRLISFFTIVFSGRDPLYSGAVLFLVDLWESKLREKRQFDKNSFQGTFRVSCLQSVQFTALVLKNRSGKNFRLYFETPVLCLYGELKDILAQFKIEKMQDAVLFQYINELWPVYDANHSGTLEPAELHWFFNDLFQRIGDPRRYTAQEIMIIFKEADKNHDGHVDKNELFRICQLIFKKQPYQGHVTVYAPPPVGYKYTYVVQRPVVYQKVTHVVHHI